MKDYPVCNVCKSDNVVLDAWAEWDKKSQEWVLRSTMDQAYCEECGGECNLEWIKDE